MHFFLGRRIAQVFANQENWLLCFLLFATLVSHPNNVSYSQEAPRFYLDDQGSHAYSTAIRRFEFECPRAAFRDVIHNVEGFAIYRILCVKDDGSEFDPQRLFQFEIDLNKDTVLVKPWVE